MPPKPTARGLRSVLKERRKADRWPSHSHIRLTDEEGKELHAELINISEDGAGVWCGDPLAKGGFVIVRLPTGRSNAPLRLVANVVNVKNVADEVWWIGLKFQRRLSVDELVNSIH